MIKQVGVDIGSYVFDKVAKTITMSGIPLIDASQITLVTNSSGSIVIYNFADGSATGGSYVPATGVLTLNYDTSSMANTDKLRILIEIPTVTPTALTSTYKSPTDFIATYTSSTTITLSSLSVTISNASQFVYIKQIKTDNSSRVFVNGFNCTMQYAAGVITIYGVGTPFVTGDLYEIGVNGSSTALDASGAIKTLEQRPIYMQTSPALSILGTAYTLTTTFTNLGGIECDTNYYNTAIIWIKGTVQTSTGIQIRLVSKHTSLGSEEYPTTIDTVSSTIVNVAPNIIGIPDGLNFLYPIPVKLSNATPFIKVFTRHTAATGTAGTIDTMYITKGY